MKCGGPVRSYDEKLDVISSPVAGWFSIFGVSECIYGEVKLGGTEPLGFDIYRELHEFLAYYMAACLMCDIGYG